MQHAIAHMKFQASRLASLALCALLALSLSPFALLAQNQVAHALPTSSTTITSFDAKVSGSNINLTISGSTWYSHDNSFSFVYPDGTKETFQVVVGNDSCYLSKDWNAVAQGSSFTRNGEAFTGTIPVPLSLAKQPYFDIIMCGTLVSGETLGLTRPAPTPDPDTPTNPTDPDNPTNPDTPTNPENPDKPDNPGQPSNPDSPANPNPTGAPTIDGDISEWGKVAGMTSPKEKVDQIKVCKDDKGNIYLALSGTSTTQWDKDYQWISVVGGPTYKAFQIAKTEEIGGTWADINEANGNAAGPYGVEVMIPAGFFPADGTITVADVTIPISSIPDWPGPSEQEKPVYNGIVIDGVFKDWGAVTRYDAGCPNPQHPNCITQTSMVFDGDQVYIYIKEAPGGSAEGAGSHGNGKYSITTDLGRTLIFQLHDGQVLGVPGATASHVGSQWEISIPKSELPPYLNTISYGLYQHQPFIKDVANLDGSGSGGSFSGIVYDGLYGDWEYYPHSLIQYATAGTQDEFADGEAALYSQGATLYGHAVTNMSAHLQEAGGEFLSAVSIAFNGDRSYKENPEDGGLYFRYVTVGPDGTIDWNPQLSGLSQGSHEFYLLDIRGKYDTSTLTNVSDFDNRNDGFFGKMTVTVGEDKDECEFYVDLNKVAAYTGWNANDFKQIDAQFGRIGTEWVTIAGTSTNPFVGIGLCIACAAGAVAYKRQQANRSQLPSQTEAACS